MRGVKTKLQCGTETIFIVLVGMQSISGSGEHGRKNQENLVESRFMYISHTVSVVGDRVNISRKKYRIK